MVTAIDPPAPDVGEDAFAGLMDTEQFWPGCVTATVRLLIRILPLRAVALGLAATAKVNEPSPTPAAALENVIHATLEVAVQLQPGGAVMSMPPDPPSASALNALMDNPTLHAAADWVTVKTPLPILMDADRACAVGLAIALQDICVLPVPLVADVTVSQSAFEVICQVQTVDKLKVPEPPVEPAVPDDGLN